MVRLTMFSLVFAITTVAFLGPGDSPADSPAAGIVALREAVADTTPRFRARLQGGADCAELMVLRDTYDPSSREVARMNEELQAIGCESLTSTRTR